MAVMTAKKKDAPVELDDGGAAEFAAAKATFRSVESELTARQAIIDNLKALLAWNAATDLERDADRYRWAREKVRAAWPSGQTPKPHKIPALLRDAEDSLQDYAAAIYGPAIAAWNIEKRRRTSALARGLQERQRRGVSLIHAGLVQISEGLAIEQACHDELARTAPESTSPFLPNAVVEIGGIGSLDAHQSSASAWRRRLRQIGLLS